MLIATGSSPVIPKIPGTELKGVYTLRGYDDFEKIKNHAKNSENIVIAGAGFIGLESASNLKKAFKYSNITIVNLLGYPFEAMLGKEIGKALQK